ncbi:MAG: hypothetical protein Q8O91_01750 [Candidatus Aminicenantes bacterium]|nr:hypothetical protein [Candidatus Aminicenantes bacterium]
MAAGAVLCGCAGAAAAPISSTTSPLIKPVTVLPVVSVTAISYQFPVFLMT